MKLLLFSLILSLPTWAKPVVVLSYYDAFGRATFNNSEVVARALEQEWKTHSSFTVKLCGLQTIYDQAYAQLENCLKDLSQPPLLVLGLGEGNCNLKIESVVRNADWNWDPDNAGNARNSVILPEAPEAAGLRYPLPEMYCALNAADRKDIQISNNAGSFVCNNTSFQFNHFYQEIPSGFIHVPAQGCKKLNEKTQEAIRKLKVMIPKAVEVLQTTENYPPLPSLKGEIEALREKYKTGNPCLYEFFKRSRGVDEKDRWPF